MKIFFYFQAIQGHGIPIEPELLGYALIPRFWKRSIFHGGLSWNFQSILGNGRISGEKKEVKVRQAFF